MKKVIFINSHPIQYFAPLYRYLNEKELPATCWYCSDENVKGHLDRQFGARVEWDIPVLEGYPHVFFKNYSWKPSLYNGFFGLINLGMVQSLFREPKSIIVVHGWAYLSNVLVLIFGRIAGHIVCLRGENPLNQELMKTKWVRFVKRIFLQLFLFRFAHYLLYIGSQNRKFYKYYGVQESKLIFVPYAVDNRRFRAAAELLIPKKNKLREQLGFPLNGKIVLFTGKLLHKKRPMDLVKAYELIEHPEKCLVMVGDGDLRVSIERYINEREIDNVFITGFINQSEIVNYYAAADIFVMCSGEGETWGLSVNEAMNFDLPVVVSAITGCADDLVAGGKTGLIAKTGEVEDIAEKIKQVIAIDYSHRPSDHIDQYSFEKIYLSLYSVSAK